MYTQFLRLHHGKRNESCSGHLPTATAQPSLEAYIHKPFKRPKQQIRLLELLPGAQDQDIELNIHTMDFSPTSPPLYEALSYAWGEEAHTVPVRAGDNEYLAISPHLASGLKRLRYTDKPRFMWIDALSICQSRLEERGDQVSIMGDIFSLAQKVVVWLGEADDNCAVALKLLQDFASLTNEHNPPSNAPDDQNQDGRIWSDAFYPICIEPRDVQALQVFFDRPWFFRLWILQEVALPQQENVLLLCGSIHLRWEDLKGSLHALTLKSISANCPEDDLHHLFGSIYNAESVVHARIRSGMGCLALGQKAQCKDPKDKVYGMLGLMEKAEGKLGIQPDYRASLSDVYQDMVLKFLAHQRRLDILATFEKIETGSNGPSWASPDPRKTMMMWGDAADGWTVACAHLLRPGILRASGVHVTVVETATRFAAPVPRELSQFAHEVTRMIPLTNLDKPYGFGGDSLFEAYCATLVAGVVTGSGRDVTSFPIAKIVDCVNYYLHVAPTGGQADQDLLRALKQFSPRFLTACENRTFLTSSNGYIGLGPPTARAGDAVVVVLGCRQPLVVRKEAQGYEIVGESYIHGLSRGEAILGPLPDEWCHKSGNYHLLYEFVNEKTGEISNTDPRLRRFAKHHRPLNMKWVGTAPHYPLLTAKRLKNNGVNVVDFDFI
jgi:hypothetical protein